MTTAMNDADRVRTEQKETDARGETRLQQITNDLGDLKGHVFGRIAREMAHDIAERFGFEMVHVLTRHEIRQMLRQHKPGDIDPRTRRSFYSSDLIGKVLDQDGNELFLTAEASYTLTSETPTAQPETPNSSLGSLAYPPAPLSPAAGTTATFNNWWMPAPCSGSKFSNRDLAPQ